MCVASALVKYRIFPQRTELAYNSQQSVCIPVRLCEAGRCFKQYTSRDIFGLVFLTLRIVLDVRKWSANVLVGSAILKLLYRMYEKRRNCCRE